MNLGREFVPSHKGGWDSRCLVIAALILGVGFCPPPPGFSFSLPAILGNRHFLPQGSVF